MKEGEYILVHYGEIALKGRNRYIFENKLVENISKALKIEKSKIKKLQGRILIEFDENIEIDKLKKVFGISWFSISKLVKMNNLEKALEEIIESKKPKTFKIEVRRVYKNYPETSIELERKIGKQIVEKFKLKVSLKNPELLINIAIFKDFAIVNTEKIPGLNGLPVGSAGNVLHLISGGIDSPVAAWFLLKRGCNLNYIHFHALPKNEDVLNSKIPKIIKVLKEYGSDGKIYVAPYHYFQNSILPFDTGLELVLFKRFMIKVALEIARKNKIIAISTGESLYQVASQTLENLVASSYKINSIEILRPLIGFDKNEIVEIAKKIGTFDLSIEEYKDCCSLIIRRPETRAKIEKVLEMEEKISMDKIVEKTLEEITEFNI